MAKRITDGIRKHRAAPKKLERIVELPEKTKGEEWLSHFHGHEDASLTLEPEAWENEVMDSREPKSGRGLLFWGVVSGGVSIVVLVVLLSTVFARLTVAVKPRVESVTFKDVSLAIDTSVARSLVAERVVPAEFLEFSRKAAEDFESTGKEFIEDKARGKVAIYNHFSSSPQTLVEGTRFLAESGALFRLSKTIVIPGAKIEEGKIVPNSIEAEIVADKAGEESNIAGEIKLIIPGFKGTAKYESFYAVASAGFAGGFKGEARVVTKDDVKKAEEQVTKKVFDELKQEILRKAPPGFLLLDALREIQMVKVSSPRAGTRRDRFPVEAEARGRVLVFREGDSKNILKEFVLAGHFDKKVVEDSFRIEYRPRSIEYEKKRANLMVQGEVKTRAVVRKEDIAVLVAGKKEGSIVEVLKGRAELASFSVAFFPPWLFSAPKDTAKIRLIGD